MTPLRTRLLAALATIALAASVGCALPGGPVAARPTATVAPAPPTTTPAAPTAIPANSAAPTVAPTAATSPVSTPTTAASAAPTSRPETRVTVSLTPSTGQDLSQTRVQFSVGDAQIIVRTADNPISRDLLSMLPLTLDFRDFNAMEKISDLPRRLTTQGSTGRAPANGDLIYFVPWGSLGIFYDTGRRDASFDDRVIPIGTIETGYERLNALETGPVRVELIP